jgi:hypothetical protein
MYRWFADRYAAIGEILPDDDAGRDDLVLMLHHLAGVRNDVARMRRLAAAWAPWLPSQELGEIIAAVLAKPLRFKADTLARRLGVTAADRVRLKLWTIGAIDETSEQRQKARRERARLARQSARRAAGAKPLKQYRAEQASRPKPWMAAGCSRRTWHRHKHPELANA